MWHSIVDVPAKIIRCIREGLATIMMELDEITDMHNAANQEFWIVDVQDPTTITPPKPIEYTDHSSALQALHTQLVHREQTIQRLTNELAQQRQAAGEMARQATHFEQSWNALSNHMGDKDAYIHALLNGKVMRFLLALERLKQRFSRQLPQRQTYNTVTSEHIEIGFTVKSSGVLEGWAWSQHDPDNYLTVNVVVNGTLAGTCIANETINVDHGDHGFRFPVPAQYKDGQPYPIRLEVANSASSYEQIVTFKAPETHQAADDFFKRQLTTLYRGQLQHFLATNHDLILPTSSNPQISIMLVLYNRAELTLQCLLSLCADPQLPPVEIIIVDNASHDETSHLLDRIQGATIIRNPDNRHFLLANNQAAEHAQGTYLLLLNNDAQVLPGSIAAALQTITSSDDIGAVGGKIMLMDGRLQEAGSIVWNDGTCLGYGRGDTPDAPMYMFQRDVDYCSGAFLLTKRALFMQDGGFDTRFAPAYYEETDYCMRLWQQHQRVVYNPDVKILHFEFASSTSSTQALNLQRDHQAIFRRVHARQLLQHYTSNPENIVLARSAARHAKHILVLDNRVPHPSLGMGYPRAHLLLVLLVELGYRVTFYPLVDIEEPWESAYTDMPTSIECMLGYGATSLEQFLAERKRMYSSIIVSRPHNMQLLKPILHQHPEWFSHIQLVYDAEALFSLRDIAQRQLHGEVVAEAEIQAAVAQETALAEGATSITCVSAAEAAYFSSAGFADVHVLGHAVDEPLTLNTFEQRSTILTVSTIDADLTPNADGLYWFLTSILPHIQKQQPELNFISVGLNRSARIRAFASQHVIFTGRVEQIEDYYNQARIFVAPTRFAAGLAMKVHQAAARGIPIVATSLIARQLGWHHDVDLLMADDATAFAQQCLRLYTDQVLWERLRANALQRVQTECSRAALRQNLAALLVDAAGLTA